MQKARKRASVGRHISLFSGIGGFDLAFEEAGFESTLVSDSNELCRSVLARHFPTVRKNSDVMALSTLPKAEILSAGFPCQDFSQAGLTRGMDGNVGAILMHLLDLIAVRRGQPDWVVFENVPNILSLKNGVAVRYVTKRLAAAGFKWAYRILDAADFGAPQRRNRWVLLASRVGDPSRHLFNSSPRRIHTEPVKGTGFYWTEGNTGIGWAPNMIPPLKGGSSFSIPSAPAIWKPESATIGVPTIEDAERLQGFPENWTDISGYNPRERWRLVGNAVNVSMARWIIQQIQTAPGIIPKGKAIEESCVLPKAAFFDGRVTTEMVNLPRHNVDNFPEITSFLNHPLRPLSLRAASGFYSRANRSSLRLDQSFMSDLQAYISKQI